MFSRFSVVFLTATSLMGVMFVCAQKVSAYDVSADSACQDTGSTAICIIKRPPINRQSTHINTIRFHPGDKVTIEAGGCVQTGGAGRTWKRYVDPYAPDAPDLYHGFIYIPGLNSSTRLLYVNGQTIDVPKVPPYVPNSLVLGYEDIHYSDNGYWGHDNGTGNQCRDVGDAWVKLTIRRK
jgi:signal peptidase I